MPNDEVNDEDEDGLPEGDPDVEQETITSDDRGGEQEEITPDDLDGEQEAIASDDAEVEVEQSTLTRSDLDNGPGSSRLRIAILVVLALVAVFLIGRVTSGGDDGGGSGSAEGEETATTGEGVPFPTGDVNRTGYWGFVQLTPLVIDTFDRPDDPESLGAAGEGGTWEAVAGTWGIRDDAAATSGGSGEGPFLAVVPEGQGDGLTEVTMTVVEEGAGLVFRYLDPSNYWSITADPSVGSWSVNRVIDGESSLVGQLAGPTADSTTLSVEQKGSGLRFLLDGEEYLAITDGALADQLQGGMIAPGSTAGQARWNRFLVLTYPAGDADAATTTTAAP